MRKNSLISLKKKKGNLEQTAFKRDQEIKKKKKTKD